MFKHDSEDTKPCRHMRGLVSALADGVLSGLARWYTQRHVADCPQCQKGLAMLNAVRERLRLIESDPPVSDAARLPESHWNQVETAWEETDREKSAPTS